MNEIKTLTMTEITYTDGNGNDFMVNMDGKKITGLYTYAETSYGDSCINVDDWRPRTNRVFIHCPAADIKKKFAALKLDAIAN